MNLQPFDMPGDARVAGVVTCVFWELVTISAFGGFLAWLKHHIGKTTAGRCGVAVSALLLAFPLAILQTCIAIPLLDMLRPECQSLFLVAILILDGVLGVAIAFVQKEPPPSAPSSPPGNPSPSPTPPSQVPHGHPSTRSPFLNRTTNPRGTP